ncbi:MAG TPA: FlgD immunoglobulin-like domain containing protein [bacterium]|nr:FlgD immunoglobulin-like domain containing protein [bacterium]
MNSKFITILITVISLLLITAFAWAAAPTAKITVDALSSVDVEGTTMMTSSGLKVIGIGETWYLIGSASSGTVTNYAWTLKTKPAASNAALSATNTNKVELVPDAIGQYEVVLSVTTADGTGETTVILTAAKWCGVGGQWGFGVDVAGGQCAYCHYENTNQWNKTKHFVGLSDNIDTPGHFASYCLSCHVTGYNAAPAAVNNGFDDIAAELGWVFPATLQAGNWTSLITNYPRLAQMSNVQCEACHGPGNQHVGKKSAIDMSLNEGTCGRCHEEPPYNVKNIQWAKSGHAGVMESYSTRTPCDQCHSGWAFIRRVDPKTTSLDGRPTNGFGQQSCAVCHDPHSGTYEGQIRTMADVTLGDGSVVTYGGTGKLCMACHHGRQNAEVYSANPANISTHFGPHGSAQADMINASNGVHYGLPVAKTGHILTTEDACVTCHMATEGNPADHNHTFSMVDDKDTEDTADDVDKVFICQPCHGDIKSFDEIPAAQDYDDDGTMESATAEIEGLMEELAEILPPAGSDVVLTKADYDWTGQPEKVAEYRKLLLKAAYNYYFVEEDLSGGIHNTAYAATLLRRSIASLKYGDIGSGVIRSISDVPQDQGKQVRVIWSKFPADGPGDMPIRNYNVWRRVDAPAAGTTLAAAPRLYRSFDEVPATLTSEVRVKFEEDLYDFVASVPAAALPQYSVVAPTLSDSTKTGGQHWSVFVITGQTELPYWYSASAPDSGYSVDNLEPMVPMNLRADVSSSGVSLTWDEPADADFKFFTLYRGETASFDPDAAQPLAKLTAHAFVDGSALNKKTYYYKLAATDFSGNRSTFASVMLNVTAVDINASLPTEFALEQNYPNPFNPSTMISFGLPSQQRIALKIYDMRGQLVRTLASGSFSAGTHQLSWDGRNDSGDVTSAGTYLYRLESEGQTVTRKMIFLK